ncbi:hypothetical protein [Frateuria terrea]|uniref:Quinol:cytochrome c oxidoreductase quinone-binding subunit 2 n=1 Tax=Frateuria terrea TaxID=529704 RepID=A0A1H6SKJ4_9GAMM|nr:hypothetical protein [Frateuria terrea]SEI68489.1 quinol:cytochrome c oxidoreductase quinone-binding subunit 2 [Frateuria terrea]SFP27116.1 quinol:cytochrome c oxidoreductase quinone-binding subunit 2 [Frateuria terrea]
MSRRWPRVSRNEGIAAAIGLLALIACLLLGLHAPREVLLSYLFAWLFWLAPALGSVGLLMIHALTGGDWGLAMRPALFAASRRLLLMALLLLPVLVGVAVLFPWAGAQAAADPGLDAQRWWLNAPFFVVRAVIVFGLWLWLARGMRRRLATPAAGRFAAAGLVLYALTVSVAAIDWVVSLVPRWHSTVFGILLGTAQLLSAAALAVWLSVSGRDPASGWWTPRRLNDLGSILMVLVLAWGYLAFMDYLTVWIADLPSETVWYLPRVKTGWRWLGAFLLLFHLALPFAVLLSRQAKQRVAWLAGLALWLFLAQIGYVAWLVLPGLREHALAWSDPLALIGIGGLWWLGFGAQRRAALEVQA